MELSGIVLQLNEHSVLLLDIKKFDLQTGVVSDYGFAMQPLIHKLKDRNFLIGGRYQMPVYQGSVPQELLTRGAKSINSMRKDGERPRAIFKDLLKAGAI